MNGTYAFAALSNNGVGGGSEPAEGVGELGTFAFDGSGNVTINAVTENSGGTITNPAQISGTYSVTASGSVTITPSSGDALMGYVSTDGNTMVVEDLTSGDTTPSIAIAVKEGASTYSAASLNGTYAFATLSNSGVGQGELGTFVFDGSGNVTISPVAENSGGAVTNPTQVSGTYSVTAGGSVTITPSSGSVLTGNLSADDSTVVAEDLTSGDSPSIAVLLEEGGTNFSNSSVSGTSSYSTLATGGSNGDVGTLGTVTLDGQGNFSGSQSVNNGQTISSNESISGTYSVAANGSLTITQSGSDPLSGNVSADGNKAVLEDLNTNDAPSIILVVH